MTLAFALKWHQQRALASQEIVELNTLALGVCERLGDEAAALIAHGNIANGMRLTGRTEQAVVHLKVELELATRLGDAFGELRALGNLANAYVTGQRFEEALPYAERQLAVAREAESQVGVRFALLMLGMAHQGTGRALEASRALTEGLAMAQEAGDTTHEGLFRLSLGEVLVELDDPERALEHIRAATAMLYAGGYRFRVNGLVKLSKASRALGKLDDALDYVTQALDLTRRHGYTTWEQRAEAELAAVREAMRTASRET
ncbi:tetratricopeptide repeat protein [Nonomuraea sp. NPDC052265]|uniref:tetratricopeptide repeat protein n=1 Tax=Nonomuraea sp. NPDC052265 TaxID=3364374 RepID=UPI0037C5156B